MIVRRADDGHPALAIDLLQQVEHVLTGFEIQVCGRLIREQHTRLVANRASDRDALLLTTGHLHRSVRPTVPEAHELEQRHAAPSRLVWANAREGHRNGDVLERGHVTNQVVTLENVADFAATQERELDRGQLRDVHLVDQNAATRRCIERTDHIEVRALAGARRPHDGDEFTAQDRRINARKCVRHRFAGAVALLEPERANDHRLARGVRGC
jgi:hypothetical protein